MGGRERENEREKERARDSARKREQHNLCAAHAVEVNELKRGRDGIYRVLSLT